MLWLKSYCGLSEQEQRERSTYQKVSLSHRFLKRREMLVTVGVFEFFGHLL